MNIEKIAVLLSTYNGEFYIEELVDSILNQTYSNFHLFIRDDCSTDSTLAILTGKYNQNNNVTIILSSENLGVTQSFSELLSYVLNYDDFLYFMFADQDDVWLNDKILISYKAIKKTKNEIPTIIHTDMYVTDHKLKIISNSFWHYQNINPKLCSLNRILLQNVVTGCNMIFNKALANKAYPIPEDAIIHDWWTSLIASTFGNIYYLNEPTMYYRQHSSNAIGASKFNFKYVMSRFAHMRTINFNLLQARKFKEIFENELDEKRLNVLNTFCSLCDETVYKRIVNVFKYKFFKNGFTRNIGYLIYIIFYLREK